MDETVWLILVTATVALDAALWLSGLLMDVTPDTRFRLLALAVVFLFVALGLIWSFVGAAIVVAVALWVFSILAGQSLPEEPAPAASHSPGH
jgi:hypothetical protein